ncbi:MAG: hypothetical protein E4H14_10260 [Candidatus Thorarchaeota archaeon]|nr:MAG: hypothetical protein E4H14_10260 [Candidatus Thorarchaeota archaeon]
MSERMSELERILQEVKGTDDVSKTTRTQFWKIVRQIKRERDPDIKEIKIATKIRNILFEKRTSRVYSLGWFIVGECVFGILFGLVYVFALVIPVSWSNILSWGFFEVFVILVRFFSLFAVIALWYPYGRLMAGMGYGIKFEGMYFSEQKEPGLKIEYESFLKAKPANRKWFFFFSGLWTFIVALGFGLLGWFLAGDIIGFAVSIVFLCFYGYVIGTGTPKNSRGEMGHYNREKKIENAWKKKE